jgi:hypothetical protein
VDAHEAVERLAGDSDYGFSVAVLGNPTSGAHMLIPLDRTGSYPMTEAEVLKARLGNFEFCGVFGYLDGTVCYQEESGKAAWWVMTRAIPAYHVHLAEKLKPRGDDYLEFLWTLPDTRTEN